MRDSGGPGEGGAAVAGAGRSSQGAPEQAEAAPEGRAAGAKRRTPADSAGAGEIGAGEIGTGEIGAVDVAAAVRAAQRGDEDAFRVIYRAVHPRLLRYLHVLVGEDAEDVASEVWLQIARDLRSFRGDADGFRGWAATVARHRAMDHLRRQRRRPGPNIPIEQLTDWPGGEDTAGSALDALSTDAALALIARLPRDQAEAVLLRVVVGLDARAAGRVLGKRAGAVRMASHRGLRRLAELVERPDGVPDAADGTGATEASP